MKDLQGKVVLVTGASSGIGAATARALAGRGARVVLGARRLDRLEALAGDIKGQGGEVLTVTLDVTRRAEMEAFAAAGRAAFGPVDVLVNNAGIMPLSTFALCQVDDWERMIDTNIKGVLYGIAAVLPEMKSRGSGHIINISSIAGHRVFPTSGVYSATKFAVNAISEGLRLEHRNIRVTVISPGATESELLESITVDEVKAHFQGNPRARISADDIASAICYAIAQPAHVDVSEMIVRPVDTEY